MRSITLLLILLMGASPALAERISDDGGGLIETYVAKFNRMRDSGEPIVVDGRCLSACTLLLAYVPRERICVTPNAVFGFHSAWSYDERGGTALDGNGTQFLWNKYPAQIRAWITANGGLHQKLIYLRGRQLAALYPSCAPRPDRGGQPEHAQAAASRVRHPVRAGHALAGMRTPTRERAAALRDLPYDRR